jgi:RNA polymerase sigma factor (sigma-70 family)
LRNQDISLQESRNTYSLEPKYQNELDNSKSLLFYPLLDRLDSNYYEGIIEQAIKYKTQTPGTVTFGHGLDMHIKSLAGIYVLAMYNSSLTHLQLLYKRIKLISFYCATRCSNWSIKKLLLKTTIVFGRQKETDGIIRCFGDLLSKMNENDAYEIYSFSNNIPIAHKRFISKLDAFRITCYHMDDERFSFVWSELYELISKWIEDENSVTVIGYGIFSALEESYLRISQNQLIESLYKEYRKDIFNHLFWLTHNPDLSEDLLQETFLQAIKSIHSFRGDSSMKTWLFAIARHLWIGHLRKNKIITTGEDISNIIVAEDFVEVIYNKAIIERIFALITTKDEKARKIFLMRVNGYSYYEISEKVCVNENSARVIDFRTKKWIKEILDKEGYL